MKGLWIMKKSMIVGLTIYAVVLFLLLYEYPVLGYFDSATLTLGLPTFVLYIWTMNALYIVITAGVVFWIIKNSQNLEKTEAKA